MLTSMCSSFYNNNPIWNKTPVRHSLRLPGIWAQDGSFLKKGNEQLNRQMTEYVKIGGN